MIETGLSSASSLHQTSASHPDATASGVTWSAVIAGAFVTAALYLILLALGAGFGLSSVSVWSGLGASGAAIGTATIVWLILAEIICSAMGGYLAGRMRSKWTVLHGDEVYFRDTAHGFLAWAVALVVTAAFLGTAATALIGAPAKSSEPEGKTSGANAYFVDSLFRGSTPKTDAGAEAMHQEVMTVFTSSLQHGALSSEDKNYLDSLVMAQTGLDQGAADQRVSDVYERAQQAAESARKAVEHALLWTFIALLIGAFSASLAGTIGGRQRDNVVLL